jgi:hypothetical protein
VLFAVDDDDDDVCSTPPVSSNIICTTATSIKINFKLAPHSACTFNWFVYCGKPSCERGSNCVNREKSVSIFLLKMYYLYVVIVVVVIPPQIEASAFFESY